MINLQTVLSRIEPYVYVVGSQAKGTATTDSDIDLYIRYTNDGEIHLDSICDVLDELEVPYEKDIEHLHVFVTCFETNLDMCHYFGVDEIDNDLSVFRKDVYGVPMPTTIDKFVDM